MKRIAIKDNYSGWSIYILAIVAMHILGLVLLVLGAHQYPAMVGMAFLAYTLGLRHAFDADHIAAIDNTVRKLVHQKENPIGVGFFFSFGHSTVVLLMAVVTVYTVHWVQHTMPVLQKYGGFIGLIVSGTFLIIIGLINLYIWIGIYKTFISIRRNKAEKGVTEQTFSGGILGRLIGMFYKSINKSWHTYILGFMFGLGFDTATQISILATSAGSASSSIPPITILALPVLFTAGMSLMDTADGFFMTTAYQWVFSTPLRKVYYNLTVTGLSVVAALFIGIVELVQIITPTLGIHSGILFWITNLNFNMAGYILVVLFLLVWVISFSFWKLLNIEEKSIPER